MAAANTDKKTNEDEIRASWKVGSRCLIHSRSTDTWYDGIIDKIEGENQNEWLIVKYGQKKKKTKKIQRACEDIKPIPNDHAIFFVVGSFCKIYSNVSCTWCDGKVIAIFMDDGEEWLQIKFTENDSVKTCDIQRYSKDLKLVIKEENNADSQKKKKFIPLDSIDDPDKLRRVKNELLISGYIREECNKLEFEWIMPGNIDSVCFNLYFIDYKKELLDLCGDKFVQKNEKNEIIPATFEQDVAGNEFILFYFSGQWCPPSKNFTPKLATFYDECKEKGVKLQIIFISCDQNKSKMEDYFKNYHGKYLAIDYDDKEKKDALSDKYDCQYIPMVTVINSECKLIEKDARYTIANNKDEAVKQWVEKNKTKK